MIAELASPKEGVVTDSLLALEKKFPTSTKAFPTIKGLLDDPRAKVRRKAARVLGTLHAEVSDSDLQKIAKQLKSADNLEVMDALKSLRGLKAQSVLPEITPLLNHGTPNVVRDACRTVATLGNKDSIPALEPLLKSPNPKIQKDAADAIYQLKAKA